MDWAGLTWPLSRQNGGSAMYIWQIKRLRQQLAIEGLVEKEAFYYYLGTAIIGALIYEAIANGPPTGAGAEPALTDYLDGILYVGFTIGGIIWCYLQNGGADAQCPVTAHRVAGDALSLCIPRKLVQHQFR